MSAVNASAIAALVDKLVRDLLHSVPFMKTLIRNEVKKQVDEECNNMKIRLDAMEQRLNAQKHELNVQKQQLNHVFMEKCYMQCYIDEYVQTNGEKFVLPSFNNIESIFPVIPDPGPTPAMIRPPPRVPPVVQAVAIPSFDEVPSAPRLRRPPQMRPDWW